MKKFVDYLRDLFVDTTCWVIRTNLHARLIREYGDNHIVVERVNAIVQNTRLSEYEILRALMALYV